MLSVLWVLFNVGPQALHDVRGGLQVLCLAGVEGGDMA